MDYDRNGLIGADGSETPFYALAQTANKQIATVDEVLMNATSDRVLAVGAYAQTETGITTNSFRDICVNSIMIEEDTDGSLEYGAIVGVFDYKGKEAYYVVNYDYIDDREITLRFAEECTYHILADEGNYVGTTGSLTGDSCMLNLTAGGAALIVLE